MIIERFVECIRIIAERSPLFAAAPLDVFVVVNPRAGGFTRARVAAKHLETAETFASEARALPPRAAPFSFRVLTTASPRHAVDLARALGSEAPSSPGAKRLVVMASGDGTSHEFLSGLMDWDDSARAACTVLRLPLGTGNDGSDGRDMDTSLGRLIRPARFSSQAALRVSCASGSSKGPWYSFNIASVGLDAFVTSMTNRLKSSLPGDSYKLWVDFASVFYDLIYRVRPMTVRAFDASGAETRAIAKRFLLVAMGVSGNRQYGSNKRILPDDDNVCAVSETSLFRKLTIKNSITAGLHHGLREVDHLRADRLVLEYDGRVLVQMDGEDHALEPADFPLVIERTPSIINTIEYR